MCRVSYLHCAIQVWKGLTLYLVVYLAQIAFEAVIFQKTFFVHVNLGFMKSFANLKKNSALTQMRNVVLTDIVMNASITVTLTQWEGRGGQPHKLSVSDVRQTILNIFSPLFFACVVGQNGSVQLALTFCMTPFLFLFRFYQIDPDTWVDACP